MKKIILAALVLVAAGLMYSQFGKSPLAPALPSAEAPGPSEGQKQQPSAERARAQESHSVPALTTESLTEIKPESLGVQVSRNPEFSAEFEKFLTQNAPDKNALLEGALRFQKYSKWFRMALVLENMNHPRYASAEFVRMRSALRESIHENENSFYNEMGPALKSLKNLPELKPEMQKLGRYLAEVVLLTPSARVPLANFFSRELQNARPGLYKMPDDLFLSYGIDRFPPGPELHAIEHDPYFKKN